MQNNKLVQISEANKYDYCGSLWVGDKNMIQSILDNHKELLTKNDWPLHAEEFFLKISSTHVEHDKNEDLYHLINKLFNIWCLFCERHKTRKVTSEKDYI